MKIRKILAVVLTFCMLNVNIMPVFADSYKLNIEKESADIKYLENDQGYISKKIINSNPENGEVTVELTVSNSKKALEEESLGDPEIMIVIDNSESMKNKMENGNMRRTEVINAVRNLVNSIYDIKNDTKIGLVRFSGVVDWPILCEDRDIELGFCTDKGTNYDYYYEGATLIQSITQNRNEVITSINNFENLQTQWDTIGWDEGWTDIALGLQKGYESFNGTSNKIIILLTDGLPVEYLHTTSNVNKNTSEYIKNLSKKTNLITVLTGVTSADGYSSQNTVKSIFGTEENPNADKFYNISDNDLSKTITENVLNDVKEYIQPNMKNVTITDYFPSDIKDNFEFSYITKPTTGTISEKIGDDNTITYTLDELKGNESVKIAYKLKLKDMSNKNLLNKVINTNEKVVLKYTDSSLVEHEVILESSPSVKLVKVEETPVDKNENVETTVENPPTGMYLSLGILVMIFTGIIGFITLKKKNYFSKI